MERMTYRFSFLIDSDAGSEVHKLRDADAFIEVSSIIYNAGYRYGGLIVNQTNGGARRPEAKGVIGAEGGTARVQPDVMEQALRRVHDRDLLVLCTRPPLHDKDQHNRRIIKRTGNKLERMTLNRLGRCFKVCSRSHILLSDRLAGQLKGSARERAETYYNLYKNANLQKCRANKPSLPLRVVTPEERPRTHGFLLVEPPAKGRHGLLTLFSIGGTETLCFAYLLRSRLWSEFELNLEEPRFVMVELVMDPPRPENPVTLDFADRWDVRMLLNTNSY